MPALGGAEDRRTVDAIHERTGRSERYQRVHRACLYDVVKKIGAGTLREMRGFEGKTR